MEYISLPPSLPRLLGLSYQQSHCLGFCALLCPFPILNSFSSFLFRVFYLTKAVFSLFPGNHVVHFLPSTVKINKLILWMILFMPTLSPQTPEHLSVNVSDLEIFDWLISLFLSSFFLFRFSNVTGNGDEEMKMASLAISQCCLFKSKASECTNISVRVCKYLNRKVLGGNFFRQCFQIAWQQSDCVMSVPLAT